MNVARFILHKLDKLWFLALLIAALATAAISTTWLVRVEAGGSAPVFSRTDALTRAQELAEAEIASSLGAQMPDGAPLVEIDGRPIRIADLTELELSYDANKSEVSSQNGAVTSNRTSNSNVWVASWERTGVAMRDRGGAGATVRVALVFEDGTGKLLAANVVRFDPLWAPRP